MHYIAAAEEIERSTAVPEARTFWAHFRASPVRIGSPRFAVGGNVHCVVLRRLGSAQESPGGPPPLQVMPVFEADGSLDESLREIWSLPLSAQYQQISNTVFIRTRRVEVPYLCGCALLHELGHAQRAWEERRVGMEYPAELTVAQLYEEGDMHRLLARLWQERGGAPYAVVLDKAVYRVRRLLRDRKGAALLENVEDWLTVLNEVFGPAPDDGARNNRMLHLSIHANLELIERASWPEPRRCRAEVLRLVYEAYVPHLREQARRLRL